MSASASRLDAPFFRRPRDLAAWGVEGAERPVDLPRAAACESIPALLNHRDPLVSLVAPPHEHAPREASTCLVRVVWCACRRALQP